MREGRRSKREWKERGREQYLTLTLYRMLTVTSKVYCKQSHFIIIFFLLSIVSNVVLGKNISEIEKVRTAEYWEAEDDVTNPEPIAQSARACVHKLCQLTKLSCACAQ